MAEETNETLPTELIAVNAAYMAMKHRKVMGTLLGSIIDDPEPPQFMNHGVQVWLACVAVHQDDAADFEKAVDTIIEHFKERLDKRIEGWKAEQN